MKMILTTIAMLSTASMAFGEVTTFDNYKITYPGDAGSADIIVSDGGMILTLSDCMIIIDGGDSIKVGDCYGVYIETGQGNSAQTSSGENSPNISSNAASAGVTQSSTGKNSPNISSAGSVTIINSGN